MHPPFFSVIVPVYKVEKYLRTCIDSVINQSFQNWELILVNDGSPDNCPQICDEYAAGDERIKAVHKENGGLSDSRNLGLNHSTGTYVVFLDSDDYWDDMNFLETVSSILFEKNSDVLVFGYKKLIEQTGRIAESARPRKIKDIESKGKEDAFNFLSQKNLYINSACSKLVKRDLLLSNGISFEKGVTSEDIEWSAKVAVFSSSLSYFPHNIYVYRQREGSITQTVKFANVQMLKENINKCLKLGQTIKTEKFYTSYMSYVAYQYITLLANCAVLTKNERNELMPFVHDNSFVLKFGKNKKVRIIYASVSLVGIRITLWLLGALFGKK